MTSPDLRTKLVVIYPCLLFVLLIVINQLFFENHLFTSKHFLNFDANHYFAIKNEGYSGFLAAFFPLFPLIWKLTYLNAQGILLLNGGVFLCSLVVLFKTINITSKTALLILSTPSLVFFFLPYSESLFFLFSVLLIYALKYNKIGLFYLCIFLCCLARPTSFFLILALVSTYFVLKRRWKKFIYPSFFIGLVGLIAILCIFFIHYLHTGNFFIYLEVSKGWGGILQVPKLPFTSWGGSLILRLDGLSLLLGILVIGYFAFKLKYRELKFEAKNQLLIFAFFYISFLSLFMLFRGGTLFSFNRFLFCNPFWMIILSYYLNQENRLTLKQIVLFFLIINLFFMLFESYNHIQNFLKFAFVSFIISLLLLNEHKSRLVENAAYIVLLIVNVSFQLCLYIRFLQNEWVG